MKKTFKELKEIDGLVSLLYKATPTLEKGKFGYNYKRFAELNFYPHAKRYNEARNMLHIEYAMEDPVTKEIQFDKTSLRGFKYTKAGLRDVFQAEIKLQDEWDAKEFDIEPRVSTTVPKLTEDEEEILKGVLI